ncbi:MAG TPA: hypothetical protein PKI14_05185 [Fervidobacterium sp.]|mgnify:CR=1 FL=1|nr:hypothetical protein [Fervidobacterium sp.]HPT54166.1 hypothetical protein [Fervidobacterium sp.]HPZ17469.1 hypothetical protein [Fervidobacterium sp.]HQE48536.1 hypothetical protein [Fervidobacterium sp.]HUM42325.1 hypothetical protein [Fervidobacterium sp.]
MGKDITVRTVMAILVDKREQAAIEVQKLLTEFGCYIKTRLGLHEGAGEFCSPVGLIILELVDDESKHQELCERLNAIEGVTAKYMKLEI